MSPTGKFCCEVEDATGTNQTLCVNICNSEPVCVQITGGGGTPTLGESYSLTCSIYVTGNMVVDTAFQWSKDGIVLNETGSTLSFQYFNVTDIGLYNCSVRGDSVLYSDTMEVNSQSK